MPRDEEARDREVRRRVYERQVEEYRGELAAARERLERSRRDLDAAGGDWRSAAQVVGELEGKIAALVELAGRDGVEL